ncbi:MAG TPA: heavy metal-binding domain-containing protein [Solirubrobacteraceae bacterium]
MGFFSRPDDDQQNEDQEPSAPAATAESTTPEEAPHAADYEAGSLAGIPQSGRDRIARMKQDVARGFFTSDLSVNEFLLVKQSGFEPLGLVLGSSIYHIGFQQAMWNQSQEMGVLTQAMYHARELAMTRMEEEADQLGADGIVGVRLDIGRYQWGADLAEFIAVGTAVKHRAGELHRAPNGRPFTSDLSGQDFSTLLRSGYRPAGLVMGNCVYHVAHQGLRASWKQIGRNQEMPNFTQALYEARELAMERMQNEADELQAGGIVGARIAQGSHGWGAHVIEFLAIGTAVVPVDVDHEIEQPSLVLPLSG